MKKLKKIRVFIFYPILGIILIMLTLITYKLNQSSVFFSENGVYTSLLVPIKAKFVDININLSGTADSTSFTKDFLEGPIVTYDKNQDISVDWFYNGTVHHKNYNNSIKNFSIDTGDKQLDFVLPNINKPITEVNNAPNKIAFISDIHGDYTYMDCTLKSLKVIDSDGNWSFNKNHLVIAGDMVDRGNEVSSVLWKIVSLSEQAREAGGMVHYLIGNHEQYILKGNFSRVDPLNLYAIQQMMSFKDAFSDKTYLGKWLRTRPVIVKIGSIVITHGGISPNTANKKISLQQINQAMWDYWENKSVDNSLKEIVLGKTGVTQYRGYIRQNDEIKKATSQQVNTILETYNASQIIIGHTNVPKIKPLYDGKVYDINAIETSSEALVFENGSLNVVDIGIIKQENTHNMYHRDFSFGKINDWKMITSTIGNIIRLSSISHPY
ncbi:Calcineurin-like phosphoesterase [Aquimarina amphilecti]|uniref:Calcineurin-like phosphoesterase n=1 Tax=Aquimarina amphilecti TaxID=1038014 RepID=A0A1H7KMI8_AQUAM|nr:metallophosphoesterase [Aquimarina amphilecti]SEK88051.1 Calcineurin-like phosphoesterase [Aquimarina amphilecti]